MVEGVWVGTGPATVVEGGFDPVLELVAEVWNLVDDCIVPKLVIPGVIVGELLDDAELEIEDVATSVVSKPPAAVSQYDSAMSRTDVCAIDEEESSHAKLTIVASSST